MSHEDTHGQQDLLNPPDSDNVEFHESLLALLKRQAECLESLRHKACYDPSGVPFEPAFDPTDHCRAWTAIADSLQKNTLSQAHFWRDSVGGMLTFISLFSAIVTAFIIQTSSNLSPDPSTETNILLTEILLQLSSNQSRTSTRTDLKPTFEPSAGNQWTAFFWNTSLFISILCAVICLSGQRWISNIINATDSHEKGWTRAVAQYQLNTSTHKSMRPVLGALNPIMILSIVFFLAGLLLQLWSVAFSLQSFSKILFATCVVCSAACVTVILMVGSTTLHAVRFKNSPFFSHHSHWLREDWIQRLSNFLSRIIPDPKLPSPSIMLVEQLLKSSDEEMIEGSVPLLSGVTSFIFQEDPSKYWAGIQRLFENDTSKRVKLTAAVSIGQAFQRYRQLRQQFSFDTDAKNRLQNGLQEVCERLAKLHQLAIALPDQHSDHRIYFQALVQCFAMLKDVTYPPTHPEIFFPRMLEPTPNLHDECIIFALIGTHFTTRDLIHNDRVARLIFSCGTFELERTNRVDTLNTASRNYFRSRSRSIWLAFITSPFLEWRSNEVHRACTGLSGRIGGMWTIDTALGVTSEYLNSVQKDAHGDLLYDIEYHDPVVYRMAVAPMSAATRCLDILAIGSHGRLAAILEEDLDLRRKIDTFLQVITPAPEAGGWKFVEDGHIGPSSIAESI